MRFPFLKSPNSQSYLEKHIDPIKRMIQGVWDVSCSFQLPDNALLSEAIGTINQIFRKLHDIVVSILISVVALSALTPKLFEIAKDFKENCESQEKSVSLISTAGLRIADRIESIAGHTTSLVRDSEIIEKQVQDSLELGERSIGQIVEIKKFVSELVEIISILDENSKSIGSIIEIINNISNETSLLSLNARIEAARSGESGKGFAVIAGEIANLATQSQEATHDIQAKLTVLEKKVHETVESVQRVENNVNEGEQVIASSNQALNNVYERFGSFSQKIVEIKSSTDDQHQDILKISDDIISIEGSIKEQASESRNIVKIAEKIKESCDQVIVDTGTFHLSGHQKVKQVAQEIAGQADIQSMQRDAQEAAMRKALLCYDFLELLYITDKNGRQVTTNVYSPRSGRHDANEGLNQQWGDREWYREPRKNKKPFVSKVYRSGATGSFCFTVSVPLFDSHKIFCGVLGVDVNFEDMLKIK